MILYYAPGACSQASHIALIEAGLPHTLVRVGRDRRLDDGRDFNLINVKGYTPALDLGDGTILTENLAILAYIADRSGKLLARDGLERWRAVEATTFMTTEIHRNFVPFFRGGSAQEKAAAADALMTRFGTLADQLGDKPFLIGAQMTIADCYLFIMLAWAAMMGVDVPPRLGDYLARMREVPSVAQARGSVGGAGAGQRRYNLTAGAIATLDLANTLRGTVNPNWGNYRWMLKAVYAVRGTQGNFDAAARQACIGLGAALIAAAFEDVDATPMAGFDPAAVDQLLGLTERHLRSVVIMPLGYRDAQKDWPVDPKKSAPRPGRLRDRHRLTARRSGTSVSAGGQPRRPAGSDSLRR